VPGLITSFRNFATLLPRPWGGPEAP
jgi:hypothetical protein